MLLFFLQIYLNPPLGALPETWEKYNELIDIDKKTFKCFNENKVINLSQVNDNYLDCSDGSDEPGTAIISTGKFYCKNEGSTPKIINSWSVNDGICDCCDGSDELLNSHASCSNVCHASQNYSTISHISNNNNNQSNIVKNQENSINLTNKNDSFVHFNLDKESDDEIITKEDIKQIKFKYQTKNWSFMKYFLISLWKDPQ